MGRYYKRTNELAHMETIATLLYKLIDGTSAKDYEASGWATQYAQHRHVSAVWINAKHGLGTYG